MEAFTEHTGKDFSNFRDIINQEVEQKRCMEKTTFLKLKSMPLYKL